MFVHDRLVWLFKFDIRGSHFSHHETLSGGLIINPRIVPKAVDSHYRGLLRAPHNLALPSVFFLCWHFWHNPRVLKYSSFQNIFTRWLELNFTFTPYHPINFRCSLHEVRLYPNQVHVHGFNLSRRLASVRDNLGESLIELSTLNDACTL